MHAFDADRLRDPVPSSSLRALLAEPGGRRRLLRAMDEGRSPTTSAWGAALDDQQLLATVGDLLDRGRLRDDEL